MPTIAQCSTAFFAEFGPLIDDLGYTISCGDHSHKVKDHYEGVKSERKNLDCICVDVTPKVGSPDPIDPALLVRIRKRILPKDFHGYPVTVTYQGVA